MSAARIHCFGDLEQVPGPRLTLLLGGIPADSKPNEIPDVELAVVEVMGSVSCDPLCDDARVYCLRVQRGCTDRSMHRGVVGVYVRAQGLDPVRLCVLELIHLNEALEGSIEALYRPVGLRSGGGREDLLDHGHSLAPLPILLQLGLEHRVLELAAVIGAQHMRSELADELGKLSSHCAGLLVREGERAGLLGVQVDGSKDPVVRDLIGEGWGGGHVYDIDCYRAGLERDRGSHRSSSSRRVEELMDFLGSEPRSHLPARHTGLAHERVEAVATEAGFGVVVDLGEDFVDLGIGEAFHFF